MLRVLRASMICGLRSRIWMVIFFPCTQLWPPKGVCIAMVHRSYLVWGEGISKIKEKPINGATHWYSEHACVQQWTSMVMPDRANNHHGLFTAAWPNMLLPPLCHKTACGELAVSLLKEITSFNMRLLEPDRERVPGDGGDQGHSRARDAKTRLPLFTKSLQRTK